MNTWLVILIYLIYAAFAWLVFRVLVRRDYLQRGKLSGFTAFLEVVVFFVHGMLSSLYMGSGFLSTPPIAGTPFRNGFAYSLMALGILGVLISMTWLGYRASLGQDVGAVRRTGIYAVTRNPQIVFYTLVILGYSLLWTTWLTVLWVVVYLFTAHIMVLTEEEYLTAKYGQDYLDYQREVPRYLPRFR